MRGISLNLILAIFTICFGSSFLVGYNSAVINLPEDNIKKFLAKHITYFDASVLYAFVNFVLFGSAAIAAFCCGYVADIFGRKKSLMINNVIGIVGALVSYLCVTVDHPAPLYVGRAISGVNSGLTIGIASMFLTEVAPRHLRGMIGACNQLAITVGIVIGYLTTLKPALNTPTLWPVALAVGGIPAAIGLVLSFFFVESPRWIYLVKHDEAGAHAAFVHMNGNENAEMFLAEMREEAEFARSQTEFKFIELFRRRDLRMPVIIAVLFQVMQQFSGINAVVTNSKQMLKTAQVEVGLDYFVLGIGATNVIATLIALPLLEKAGRRTLLLWPSLVLAVTLLLLVIFVNVANRDDVINKTPYALTSVTLVFVYVLAFAVGLGPLPALIVAEIFRQGPRASAFSLSLGIQWACNLAVTSTFSPLDQLMGGYVYLPFLVIVVVCWIVFFLFMPETKNRTFDEVARDLAFGTIVVGKRTAAIQAPVFTKEDDEAATALHCDDDDVKV
ncbi:hypothetical protein Aperf_G00000036214 [Anoplocephala perfoliata]